MVRAFNRAEESLCLNPYFPEAGSRTKLRFDAGIHTFVAAALTKERCRYEVPTPLTTRTILPG